MPDWVKQ